MKGLQTLKNNTFGGSKLTKKENKKKLRLLRIKTH